MTHREHTYEAERDGAYSFEHTFGWFLALVAIALGTIGLLVGFGVIGGSEAGINIDEAAGAGSEGASDWLQGTLWLLPAISIALLSRALHSSDHHERRSLGEEHDGMFAAEHGLHTLPPSRPSPPPRWRRSSASTSSTAATSRRTA